MAFPQLYSGARATVVINGQPVVAAHVADWTIETRATEIETLDCVFPLEIAPDRVRVSMNLRVYRTPDNDPVASDFIAGSNTQGQPEQNAFTQAKYISVEIRDSNDATICYLPRAWIVRRSASLAHGDFMTETWAIVSMGFMGPQGSVGA